MAGFFGLFSGKKNQYVDEPQSANTDNTEQGAFFLSNDEAKTLGDIDFMRQSKKVRRTFPKTAKGKGAELVQEISSLDKAKLNPNQVSSSTSSSQPAPSTQSPSSQSTTPRRSAGSDNTMDMFRKMAKDLKK